MVFSKKNTKKGAEKVQWYALIKWHGGNDDGKYTSGIPVEWIKQFDVQDYLTNGNRGETAVIEWRKTAKPPSRGWDVYDGYVVAITKSVKESAERMRDCQGVASPHRSLDALKNSEPSLTIGDTELTPRSTKPKGLKTMSSNKSLFVSSNDVSRPKSTNIPDASEPGTSSGERSLEVPAQIIENIWKAVREMQTMNQNMANRVEARLEEFGRKLEIVENAERRPTLNEAEDVEIFPGSNVKIPSSAWMDIQNKSTPTGMAISLVTAAFDPEVLLVSNLKGGKNKVSKNEDAATFQALDPKKMTAIRQCLKRKFPNCDMAKCGSAINNKLNKLRKKRREEGPVAEITAPIQEKPAPENNKDDAEEDDFPLNTASIESNEENDSDDSSTEVLKEINSESSDDSDNEDQ